jgi:alpha-amylase
MIMITGWTRPGHPSHSRGAGLGVILNASRASYAHKQMNVGAHHAGEIWTDIMGWAWGTVVIDHDGWGLFPVGPRSMGVWVNERAEGRRRMDELKL